MKTTSIAKEISEYAKLGYCMKETAGAFGMACTCAKCLKAWVKPVEDKTEHPKLLS